MDPIIEDGQFVPFPKIPRLKRGCIITEKIDGTNAIIHITEDGRFFTGSRSRWITPADDNHGFARWALEHKDELMLLGPGRHFGEWWGQGIQRRYGLTEKRFSLFNASRWTETPTPVCCHVVPTIFIGPFSTDNVDAALHILRTQGSIAAPGFDKPEGIIVYLPAARELFKVTLENDEQPKGLAEAA